MPFVKGKSGNPGGRPKLDESVVALARAASPKAMARMVELIDSEDEGIALKAAEKVIRAQYLS